MAARDAEGAQPGWNEIWRVIRAEVRRMGVRADSVEDVTQEAVMKAMRFRKKLGPEVWARVWEWVCRKIACRTALNHFRTLRRRRSRETAGLDEQRKDSDSQQTPRTLDPGEARELARALKRLSAEDRAEILRDVGSELIEFCESPTKSRPRKKKRRRRKPT